MISRRQFLGFIPATAATIALPSFGCSISHRTLSLSNIHTGEKITSTYWENGFYNPSSLRELSRVLRDHHNDTFIEMDKRLFDSLYLLQCRLDSNKTYEVLSAYRSPETNQKLSRLYSGVAKKSLHMEGKAVDIRLPSTDLKHIRNAALDMKMGGVGYYPNNQFLHLDVGQFRSWKRV